MTKKPALFWLLPALAACAPLARTAVSPQGQLPANPSSQSAAPAAVQREVMSLSSSRWLVVLRSSDKQGYEARLRARGLKLVGYDATLGLAEVEGGARSDVEADPDASQVTSDLPRLRIHPQAARADAEPAAPPSPAPGTGDLQPFQNLQWGLSLIHAPEAWAAGDQGKGVTVAVLDTGVDADNPNLAPNLDMADSKSFVPGEDLTDLNGHGSHVAGIIAAARNGTGVAGVAPEARIMSVKVLDKDAYGADFDILEGIRYAADHHADVINLSLEDRFPWGSSQAGHASRAYERAIRYATMKGSLVIAGTGNDGEEERVSGWSHIPADLPLVVGVSAVGPVGQQNFGAFAPYSNWGSPMVQVAAPGGGIGFDPTTGPHIVDPRDLVFSTWSTHAIPHVLDGVPLGPAMWSYMAGTSMACAEASGVAALAIAADREPPMAIAERLRRTASGSGYNPYTGSGIVDAYRAATD